MLSAFGITGGPAGALPRGASKVYLSPHHDDVAFSLGGLVSAHPGGELVNLFTASNYLAGAPLEFVAEAAAIARVTALRTAEDTAFAAATGLTRRALGNAEPPILGRDPWDLRGLQQDIDAIASLLGTLEDLGARLPAPRWLFCPLAAGPHVNHLAVRRLVVASLPALEQRYAIAFYEDLPYAASGRARRRAVRALRAEIGPRRLRRLAWQLSPAEQARKLDLVRLYASQHSALPVDLGSGLSPGALLPWGPHEAAWVLAPR